jgi:predicted CxxxxCH...CXXCH cytochrome family protein
LDGRGVNVDFSAFAVSKGPTVWDTGALTCNDGWCHTPSLEGVPSPSWTSDTRLNCNGCHAMPPTAPHPPVENCALCHADVINAAGTIIARELHVDGVVQLKQSTECTGCHGQAGEDPLGPPPRDTLGNSGVEARGVGAHAAHLVGRGLARVLECAECHRVPTAVEEQGHIDSPLPAEVTLTGVAAAFAAEPSYDAGRCAGSYCHGDRTIGGRPSGGQHTVPEWTSTDDSQISCQSCHGMPPPAPHPDPAADCGECHKNADGNDGFLHPELHVDGKVTFFLSREDAAEHFAQEVSSP